MRNVIIFLAAVVALCTVSWGSYTLGKFDGSNEYHQACYSDFTTIIVDENSPHTVVACVGAGVLDDDTYLLLHNNNQ